MKAPITIGQRIAAAVLAHQLGITADRAMKSYVLGRELDPSWEQVGEVLLKSSHRGTGLPPALGPQLVRAITKGDAS